MVDTGIGDTGRLRAGTKNFADIFGFYVEETRGTLDILERAFDQAKNLLDKKERSDNAKRCVGR
jgi:hypothetical protein